MKSYRGWLILGVFFVFPGATAHSQKGPAQVSGSEISGPPRIKLFLCGDVMTGRGIDQALPHPVDPVLYETWVKDAGVYLRLAERKNGPLGVPLAYDYIWGDALDVWNEEQPQFKLINLETSITTHNAPWPGKGINYRMHPKNAGVLTAAGIDHCSLANNHTLDWGRPGLMETMETLKAAKIKFSGAGRNAAEARKPSVLPAGPGRILVYSWGMPTSGIPWKWAAKAGVAGVNLLPAMDDKMSRAIARQIQTEARGNDLVIFSVHWGGNWGYAISPRQRTFAHQLVDEAGADIIFGHSSHHPMGMEVYKEKLIIYGAGDFINDYEGISGHEEYRGELTLMYFPVIDPGSGNLVALKLIPMKIKKFRLNRPSANEARWLQKVLNREGEKLGTNVLMDENRVLWLDWK